MSKLKKAVKSAVMLLKSEKKVAVPKPVNTSELLKGKVALITGGSGGIGFAMAESFVKSGCKVIIAGTNEEKLQRRCEEVVSQTCVLPSSPLAGRRQCKEGVNMTETPPWGGGVSIKPILINVLDIKSMPEKIRNAAELFEENRIDILVNCAGVINHSSYEDISEEEYDFIMDINTKGTFFMCQAMGAYMIENHIKGHILNVTSSSALRPAWTPYQMSKWAVRGFTLGLADTLLPHGIIVNAIAPGPVATAMLGKSEEDNINNPSCPIGRYAVPREIAALATFMVSDMGDMIVGDTFYMTGGSGTISLQL